MKLEPDHAEHLPNRTVLIVDAEPHRDLPLHRALAGSASLSLIVDVNSESQAFQQARQVHPSLVILIGAAVGGRLHYFVRRLRRIVPAVPVFLLTDSYDMRSETKALGCEITAVFSKLEDPMSVLANLLEACADEKGKAEQAPAPPCLPVLLVRPEPVRAGAAATARYLEAV